jgi:hypothetical protein
VNRLGRDAQAALHRAAADKLSAEARAARMAARGIFVDGARSLCRHCGEWIEHDTGNAPPWTHEGTGYADCRTDETYAEPDLDYLSQP